MLRGILAVSSKRGQDNTLRPYNALLMRLGRLWNAVGCFRSVHPRTEIRLAAEASEKEIASFATSLGLHPGLYQAIRDCELPDLDEKTQRLVKQLLRDFRRAGVDRDESTRKQVQALREELVATGQEFLRNIVNDVRAIELDDSAELDGLPGDYVQERVRANDGKIRITTDYPDYNPFMAYARSDERRRQLYSEFRQRGCPGNLEVLKKLMTRRHELATLLGYPSWAAYVTEDKMIKAPERIAEFIERVNNAARERSHREYDALLEEKIASDRTATQVHDWEKTYLQEILRAREYRVDSKEIRNYFEYSRVKNGILALVEQLFGLRFERQLDLPRWHADVEIYDVTENGAQVGRVYLDMHPREGKFKHAAMFPLVRGVRGQAIPQAALVCNFPNPATSQGPALLEHDDVLTLLHEFGHLLHQLFASEQPWVKFNGVSNEWDFIEVPSQLFEEWGWDHDVLQRFAVHHQTGQVIPRELVSQMRQAKAFGRSLWVRHQVFYAALSLKCYGPEAPNLDTTQVVEELQNAYSLFRFVKGTYFQASFGHLDDYSALYYTYMWSLVIEKDIHEVWKREGLMNSATATRYRETLLKPGSSQDAADMVRSFLGREYSFAAFEAWMEEQ